MEQITTIACPINMADPNIDPETSPIWVDADNNKYYIASSVLNGDYTQSDSLLATPNAISVAINMNCLEALSAMGLTPSNV